MTPTRKAWTAPRVLVLALAASAEAGGGTFSDGDGGFSSGIIPP